VLIKSIKVVFLLCFAFQPLHTKNVKKLGGGGGGGVGRRRQRRPKWAVEQEKVGRGLILKGNIQEAAHLRSFGFTDFQFEKERGKKIPETVKKMIR
jgi:hypothetical protein